MSNATYNGQWAGAMAELAEQVHLEDPTPEAEEGAPEPEPVRPTSIAQAFQHFACLYIAKLAAVYMNGELASAGVHVRQFGRGVHVRQVRKLVVVFMYTTRQQANKKRVPYGPEPPASVSDRNNQAKTKKPNKGCA